MALDNGPVIMARVLLQHGLSDDAVVNYLAGTYALDRHRCSATLVKARVLAQQEAEARRRAGNC